MAHAVMILERRISVMDWYLLSSQQVIWRCFERNQASAIVNLRFQFPF